MKNFILNLLFAAIFLAPASGQKCKTSELRQRNIAQNPAILEELNRINEFTETWIRNHENGMTSRAVVTVPVVVHVLWRTSQQNISDVQIQSQIAVLNDDFRKLNSDFPNTPAPFQNVAADVEIEFCLASVDPNGAATNGITRTQTNVDNIGETDLWYQSSQGGKDAWDNTSYINIWVCDMGDDGTLGFAFIPGSADPPESDGMVIGYEFFGTTGAVIAPNDLGRTVTHEMGHYFNLEHVWGPGDGGCGEDDFVADTPLQFEASSECPSFPYHDDCTPSGNGIMFNNYLDYVDDACMTMFTQGQKMRMLAALNGPRASLLSSTACGFTPTHESADFENELSVSPNPAGDMLQVSLSEKIAGQNVHIRLYDLIGKVHKEFILEKTKTIDVSDLPGGIYFLACQEFPQLVEKVVIAK